MRMFALAVLAATALAAGPAPAQQAPAPGQDAAASPMPARQSAAAQMSGPGDEPETGRKAVRRVAVVGDADPGAILAVARSHGEARLRADSHGDPLIEAVAGGRPYDITFYECTGNAACQSIMLRAGFRAGGQTAAEMAAWNRGERFGKAYLDAAGNPVVEMNVNLAGGVTLANLEDTFARWQATVDAFAGHVGY